jgi:hypothetical protein
MDMLERHNFDPWNKNPSIKEYFPVRDRGLMDNSPYIVPNFGSA